MQVADQISTQLQQAVTPNYDHIELSEEEIEAWTTWALRIARKKKAAVLAEMNYAKKLREPAQYKKFNYDELRDFIVRQNLVVDESDKEQIAIYQHAQQKYFVLDDDNRDIFETLCMYFSNDPAFELSGEYSFEKGIILNGPIGCGKTELMRLFSINSFRPFQVTPCRRIADLYQNEGVTALNRFSELLPVYPQRNLGFAEIGHCFDDLGTEDDKKNFGNQLNVMQEIIYRLYDNRLIGYSHMTTNLGGDEIDAMYGTRIRSRMREMYNQIMFSPTARDRRK